MLGFDEIGVTAALLVLVAAIGIAHPEFLKVDSLLSVARSASLIGLVAYGMVYLLAQREIDLSVGGVYAVSLLVTGRLMGEGMDPWLGLVVAPLVGMALSAVNGVVSNLFSIPIIIVSLGTFSMYSGLATVVTNGLPLQRLPVQSSFFSGLGENFAGIPVSVWVVVLAGVLLTVVFTRTRFGLHVRSVGANPEAARLSGISPERVRMQGLLLTGALCGLAGMLSLSYLQGADASVGNGFELQVIAAAIIGGTAVTGGSGTVPGALLGALIVSVIVSGLVYFSISPNYNNVVTGGVVLLAVASDGFLRRRRARRRIE